MKQTAATDSKPSADFWVGMLAPLAIVAVIAPIDLARRGPLAGAGGGMRALSCVRCAGDV